MTIDLATIPEDPGGHALAGPDDRDEVDVWMAEHWSNWRVEVLRALDKNNLVIARDDRGIHRVLCASRSTGPASSDRSPCVPT